MESREDVNKIVTELLTDYLSYKLRTSDYDYQDISIELTDDYITIGRFKVEPNFVNNILHGKISYDNFNKVIHSLKDIAQRNRELDDSYQNKMVAKKELEEAQRTIIREKRKIEELLAIKDTIGVKLYSE